MAAMYENRKGTQLPAESTISRAHTPSSSIPTTQIPFILGCSGLMPAVSAPALLITLLLAAAPPAAAQTELAHWNFLNTGSEGSTLATATAYDAGLAASGVNSPNTNFKVVHVSSTKWLTNAGHIGDTDYTVRSLASANCE